MSATARLRARAMARGHIGALLALAFAILGGTTLVTAGAVLTETSLRSQVPPVRLADAQVLVSSPQRVAVAEDFDVRLPERATVPSDLVDRIATVPGVDSAVADVSVPVSVTISGQTRTHESHPWPVAALGDPELRGSAPSPDSVVLDTGIADPAGLDVGDRIDLAAGGTHLPLRISGVVDAPGTEVHLDPATLSDLSPLPSGASDLVAVRLGDGASPDEVAAAISDVVGSDYAVTTGDARGAVESLVVGDARLQLLELSASAAGTLLLLVGLIVASAVANSVANQRRELALLRAVGATPRQVRGLVARQATAAAAAGLVPGVALGYLVAGWLGDQLAERGLLSTSLPLVTSPLAGAVVVVLTLLVVQLTARGVSLRASRRPATEALGEARVEPRHPSRIRTVVGLGLIALSLAPAFGSLAFSGEDAFLSAVSGTLVGIVGLALAGPVIARTVTGRLAGYSGRQAPVVRWLALHHTHAYSLRTAGAVSVLALAFSLTVAQVYAQSTLERATAAEQDEAFTAAATVSGPMTAAEVADLGEVAGVDAAVPLVTTSIVRTSRMLGDSTTERSPALALGPGADRVVDLDVAAGDLADLEGESVALAEATAGRWGVEVGDRVDLRLGNGDRVSPVVAATYRRGLGFGAVVVSTDLLAAHGLARSSDTVLVDGDGAAVAGWAASRPEVAVAPGASMTRGDANPERWISLIVLLPMLGYVLVAVANSLRTTTSRRREEMATLRMLGATPRQIRAMVTREAALLTGLAIAAGTVLAVLPMSVLGLGVLARPWPQGPLWVIPAISALVAVTALAAMRGATRRVLRAPVLGHGS
ncbi:FtsX-like permease family protein [Aeromicrobium sp.]|uniref:FtsX-like permease family protein n=1 Tax=Aeromicrobium sp. TaxID=1871063 RepID=UPI0028AC19B2|nr:FtsX-like permease family protein [Aeromicrobium sp.]